MLNIEEDPHKIDHHRSIHSKSLQRSKYLMIEDEIESLKKIFELQNKNIRDKMSQYEIIGNGGPKINNLINENLMKRKCNEQILLRFCQQREI